VHSASPKRLFLALGPIETAAAPLTSPLERRNHTQVLNAASPHSYPRPFLLLAVLLIQIKPSPLWGEHVSSGCGNSRMLEGGTILDYWMRCWNFGK
jgi:hypothetical protein